MSVIDKSNIEYILKNNSDLTLSDFKNFKYYDDFHFYYNNDNGFIKVYDNKTKKEYNIFIYFIKSDEIRLYYKKKIPEYFLKNYYEKDLKLSDFNIDNFIINKDKETITYNDITIDIKDITIQEIKQYFLNKIKLNDTDISKYIIKTIKYNGKLIIDINMYNSLKDPKNKLYILKYIFSKYDLESIQDIDKLFSIFQEHPNYLIDLIKQVIITNSKKQLEYILKNKNIIISSNDYNNLIEYSSMYNLFELTKILISYESFEYLTNDNKDDIIKDNNILINKLWN